MCEEDSANDQKKGNASGTVSLLPVFSAAERATCPFVRCCGEPIEALMLSMAAAVGAAVAVAPPKNEAN